MEKIIIGGIVGGMYALAIALYKSASKSLKFSDIQRVILFFLIVFPPLFFAIIIPFYIYNSIKYNQKKEIKQLKESVKQVNDLESAKEKLKSLKESNIIDDKEFLEKNVKIENQINNQFLINTEEYKNLKSLYEGNILSKEEFEEKIEKIKLTIKKENIINKPKRYIKEIKYFGENYSIKMGKTKEYHLIMNDNKGIKIYEKKDDGKCFCHDKNNLILLFPNKEACIKHIEERI